MCVSECVEIEPLSSQFGVGDEEEEEEDDDEEGGEDGDLKQQVCFVMTSL